MSPISRRRWANFKANRRGWYALWMFSALFGTSLLAEFIANDKPILLWMNGELHMPVIRAPTEQELGGELPIIMFSWMALVSVVRAEFLRTRNFDYVRAARSLGVSNVTTIRRHVLPNAMVAALTFLPFILCGAVTTLTALDFLGFGLPAGSPSLGELLQQGKANLHAPWLGLTGFFALGLMLCLLIFIGEAVRDALDPRRSAQGPPGFTT